MGILNGLINVKFLAYCSVDGWVSDLKFSFFILIVNSESISPVEDSFGSPLNESLFPFSMKHNDDGPTSAHG